MSDDYILIGAQSSYYSAKVRACLQYKRLPYTEKVSNLERISQQVIPRTGDHSFPVVITGDDEYLKDSCDIVRELERRHPERPMIPADPVLVLISELMEAYADEFFIIPALYYRWMFPDTRDWAMDMFHKLGIYETDDPESASQMAQHFANDIQSRLPQLGLDDPLLQTVLDDLSKRLADKLEVHLAHTACMLGDHPCLADLALMNAFYAHLYRDPCTASDYIRRHCLYLSQWIDRMHAAAGESAAGELYLAETFKPVLAEIGSAFASMALAALEQANAKLPAVVSGELAPAGLGEIDADICGTIMTRPISSYTVWKIQRLMDTYRALPAESKEQADRYLGHAGMLEVCQFEANFRLEKRDYKIYIA